MILFTIKKVSMVFYYVKPLKPFSVRIKEIRMPKTGKNFKIIAVGSGSAMAIITIMEMKNLFRNAVPIILNPY